MTSFTDMESHTAFTAHAHGLNPNSQYLLKNCLLIGSVRPKSCCMLKILQTVQTVLVRQRGVSFNSIKIGCLLVINCLKTFLTRFENELKSAKLLNACQIGTIKVGFIFYYILIYILLYTYDLNHLKYLCGICHH